MKSRLFAICPVAELGLRAEIGQSQISKYATKRKARQTKSPANEKPGVIAGLLASNNRLNNGAIENRLCRACLFKM
jgi:hypothetical protein